MKSTPVEIWESWVVPSLDIRDTLAGTTRSGDAPGGLDDLRRQPSARTVRLEIRGFEDPPARPSRDRAFLGVLSPAHRVGGGVKPDRYRHNVANVFFRLGDSRPPAGVVLLHASVTHIDSTTLGRYRDTFHPETGAIGRIRLGGSLPDWGRPPNSWTCAAVTLSSRWLAVAGADSAPRLVQQSIEFPGATEPVILEVAHTGSSFAGPSSANARGSRYPANNAGAWRQVLSEAFGNAHTASIRPGGGIDTFPTQGHPGANSTSSPDHNGRRQDVPSFTDRAVQLHERLPPGFGPADVRMLIATFRPSF